MDLSRWLNDPRVNQLLVWLGLGLFVGVAAKMLLPGRENIGWIKTIALGLIGSVGGNYLTPRFLGWPAYSAFSWQGILIGIAGALILVVVNRIVTKS